MARKKSGGSFVKNGVQFNLENEDMYHYEAFTHGTISSEELRKEYSRLRQTANKRLDRMKGTRYEDTKTYKYNAGKYTTLAQIEAEALRYAKKMKPEAAQKYVDSYVAHKLADMYKFLTSKTGSIRGMQKVENETIQTLREKGLTFINKSNIVQFGDYMEYLRSIHKGKQFDSERAVELFGTASKKGINPDEILEDYEYWKEREQELAKTPKIKNEKRRTAEDYKKLLNRKK